MATELTGRSDAVALLSKLRRDYLLVERHGESSFRLHDLLRMFLLERGALERDETTQVALSVRAAWLLAESDQFPAAVELLAACRSWGTLGDLAEKHAPVLARQGRVATLYAALELMPPALRDARAWLVFWRAVFMLGHDGGRGAGAGRKRVSGLPGCRGYARHADVLVASGPRDRHRWR